MQKFIAPFKFPCNFHSESPQAKQHRTATPETHPAMFGETLICIADGKLYQKQPKHYTGVINMRASGGKWQEVRINDGLTIESYLDKIGAKEASFRGSPRIAK